MTVVAAVVGEGTPLGREVPLQHQGAAGGRLPWVPAAGDWGPWDAGREGTVEGGVRRVERGRRKVWAGGQGMWVIGKAAMWTEGEEMGVAEEAGR